jgi:hypothetical protein
MFKKGISIRIEFVHYFWTIVSDFYRFFIEDILSNVFSLAGKDDSLRKKSLIRVVSDRRKETKPDIN